MLLGFFPIKILASPVIKHQDLLAVVEHLEGIMDTSAQAHANPQKAVVRMTTCRVHLNDNTISNKIFLYQEQALVKNLANPYRQRFLEIGYSPDKNQVVSVSYKPTMLQNWQGLCNLPEAARIITKDSFNDPLCQVFLKPLINIYLGTTPSEGCPTNFRGAVRITNHIILHEQGMDTWDRGFDSQGNQVWGAKEDAYQFRWSNP